METLIAETPRPALVAQESYWTYRAPPTPAAGPPGFKGDWFALSPGMRREIWRSYQDATTDVRQKNQK